MRHAHSTTGWIAILAAVLIAGPIGCGSKPAAEVSKKDLAATKESHANVKVGDPKKQVLDSFKSANKVKLGSSDFGGATIEEWKIEAFNDQDNRKDLFITFLYFCNDRLADSSDTRIDYRNNPTLVEKWKGAAAH